MTDWQPRALRLRAAGHTLIFIAGQVSKQAGVPADEVIVFLVAHERDHDARKEVESSAPRIPSR